VTVLALLISLTFVITATATTQIYTLSLHDALPIWENVREFMDKVDKAALVVDVGCGEGVVVEEFLEKGYNIVGLDANYESEIVRSEEHTSELQSRENLVCRLLLEKKKTR